MGEGLRSERQGHEETRRELRSFKGLLSVAQCPQCDGSGAYPVPDGRGGCEDRFSYEELMS